MSEMGGLRKNMPVTFWTFLIGSLALVGIPPFAGFFSKDEIIATAFHTHHYAIWLVALATAFVTALYMTRAIVLTFAGDYRGAGHPHESPPAMTGPMALLAALSVGAGFRRDRGWRLRHVDPLPRAAEGEALRSCAGRDLVGRRGPGRHRPRL